MKKYCKRVEMDAGGSFLKAECIPVSSGDPSTFLSGRVAMQGIPPRPGKFSLRMLGVQLKNRKLLIFPL